LMKVSKDKERVQALKGNIWFSSNHMRLLWCLLE
jgi:hypothetical protein